MRMLIGWLTNSAALSFFTSLPLPTLGVNACDLILTIDILIVQFADSPFSLYYRVFCWCKTHDNLFDFIYSLFNVCALKVAYSLRQNDENLLSSQYAN